VDARIGIGRARMACGVFYKTLSGRNREERRNEDSKRD